MTTRPRLLVVVPAYNEARSVEHVVEMLLTSGYEVLVVDDGSRDDTAKRARVAGALVLRLPINLGVGGALRAGFRYAVENGFEAVVQVDADGQHPVTDVGRLLDTAHMTGADLVLGSRFRDGVGLMNITPARKLAMKVLAVVSSLACRTKITDATSGFRLIRGQLLEEFSVAFPAYYLGDTYEALVSAGRSGFQVTEVGVPIGPRLHGESTSSVGQSLRFLAKTLVVVVLNIHFRIGTKESG